VLSCSCSLELVHHQQALTQQPYLIHTMTHIKIIRNICYNVSPKLSVFITFQEVISQTKSCPPHLEHAALIVSDIQKSSHAQRALCGLALWKCDVVCRGVYGVRLRSSIFGRRACVYSKIFRDIPLVRTNAISKNSNNVVISSPRVLIFSWILVPYDSFPYIWSREHIHFRFGR